MLEITSAQRRAFRAAAHHLTAVVSIGHHGLTPPVQHEIDLALLAHELIKVKVAVDDRTARNALLELLCAALECAPVQHLGKQFILWRPNPDKKVKAPKAIEAARAGKSRAGKPGKGRGAKAGSTTKRRPAPSDARPPAGEDKRRYGSDDKRSHGGQDTRSASPNGARRSAPDDKRRSAPDDKRRSGSEYPRRPSADDARRPAADDRRRSVAGDPRGAGPPQTGERGKPRGRTTGANAPSDRKPPAGGQGLPYFSRRGAGRFVAGTSEPAAKPPTRRRTRGG